MDTRFPLGTCSEDDGTPAHESSRCATMRRYMSQAHRGPVSRSALLEDRENVHYLLPVC